MKSNAYILSVSILAFLAVPEEVKGCGPYWNDAKDYIMYRVYDNDNKYSDIKPDALCIDWQKLAGGKASLKDINAVIYCYSIEDFNLEVSKEDSDNSFICWIQEQKNNEIPEYIRTAKMNEKIHSLQTSKWYYPCKEDGVSGTLEDIIRTCTSYCGHQLKDRYVLQALRAMYYIGDFEELSKYWEKLEKSLPEGTIKDMCIGYAAGAWFRLGLKEKAMRQYAELGDLSSLKYCLCKIYPGRHEEQYRKLFKYIATYCPDHPHVPELLQEWHHEHLLGYNFGFIDVQTCLQAAGNPLCESPAIWYYTAAYLQDAAGQYYLAAKTLEKAVKANGPEFIRESIKVMRIYLDAKTNIYNKAYEKLLFSQLRWLESKITENINSKVKEITEKGYALHLSFSYYYWNDMMRKIIIGEVAPRMIQAGKETLAIRLVNMADNMFLNLVGTSSVWSGKTGEFITVKLDRYRNGTYYNHFDYSNFLFMMINGQQYPSGLSWHCRRELPTVSQGSLIKYVNSLSDSEKTPFERYLDEKGFTDTDYFYDVIGTRYLREMKYDKAVTYLSKVSGDYQKRLNTSMYMYRDPFIYIVDPGIATDWYYNSTKTIPDYKLSFAKEMARLDMVIANSDDQEEVGLALFRKGCGLRASFSLCWPLTQYSRYFDDEWAKSKNLKPIIAMSNELVKNGIEKVKDKETKAKLYYQLGLLKTLLNECPDTQIASHVRSNCDNASDYGSFIMGRE